MLRLAFLGPAVLVQVVEVVVLPAVVDQAADLEQTEVDSFLLNLPELRFDSVAEPLIVLVLPAALAQFAVAELALGQVAGAVQRVELGRPAGVVLLVETALMFDLVPSLEVDLVLGFELRLEVVLLVLGTFVVAEQIEHLHSDLLQTLDLALVAVPPYRLVGRAAAEAFREELRFAAVKAPAVGSLVPPEVLAGAVLAGASFAVEYCHLSLVA